MLPIFNVFIYKNKIFFKGPLSNYIYFRIIARVLFKVEELEIYINLNIIKTIIDRKFFNTLKYSISIKYKIKICSINGKIERFLE